jgi:hypothetical protein
MGKLEIGSKHRKQAERTMSLNSFAIDNRVGCAGEHAGEPRHRNLILGKNITPILLDERQKGFPLFCERLVKQSIVMPVWLPQKIKVLAIGYTG